MADSSSPEAARKKPEEIEADSPGDAPEELVNGDANCTGGEGGDSSRGGSSDNGQDKSNHTAASSSTRGGRGGHATHTAIHSNAHHHHHHHHYHHHGGAGSSSGGAGGLGGSGDPSSAIKLLVSSGLAGCLIGKGGSTINDLQERTNARIKLSQNQDYFPGTQDRIVLISGDPDTVTHALSLVIEHLHSNAQARAAAAAAAASGAGTAAGDDGETAAGSSPPSTQDEEEPPTAPSSTSPSPSPPSSPPSPVAALTGGTTSVKLLIAKGAGGLVIGRAGATIKALNEESGARIQLAAKDDAGGVVTGERVVTISGALDGVLKGVARIMEKLQEEPELARYQNLTTSYSRSTSAAHPMHPAFDIPTYHTQSFAETQALFSPGGPSPHSGHVLNHSLSHSGHSHSGHGGHSHPGHGPPHTPHGPGGHGPPHGVGHPGHGGHHGGHAHNHNHGHGHGVGHSHNPHGHPAVHHPGVGMPGATQSTATLTLQVPDKLVGSILGKGGLTLKELQSQSGARIIISKRGEYAPGTQNRVVTIDGPAYCAELARNMVTVKVQQASMAPPPGSY